MLINSHDLLSLILLKICKKLKRSSAEILGGAFLGSHYFCHLLITFANSLDPDQGWQNIGPDLDPNRLTLW